MTPLVVMISGKQGSGKSSLASNLRASLEGMGQRVASVRFASAIYEMHDWIRDYMRSRGIDRPEKDGRLLQLLGTEWGRDTISPDVWVNLLENRIEEMVGEIDVVLIDDCRFPNELALVNRFSGLTIRLDADRNVRKARCPAWRDTDTHSSETALDNAKFDTWICTDTVDEQYTARTALEAVVFALEERRAGGDGQ